MVEVTIRLINTTYLKAKKVHKLLQSVQSLRWKSLTGDKYMVARYICLEGTEGVGKTTQTQKLVDHLRSKGFKVLQTKEPGTAHAPLTMVLRGIMLDKQYDEQLTAPARELISQAIRSIHLEKVISSALDEYDFIVQDRGILSGLAYGEACGNDPEDLHGLLGYITEKTEMPGYTHLYDDVIYLRGNVSKGLEAAKNAKQEFAAGDAIEAKGVSFMENVNKLMMKHSDYLNGVKYIDVDNKSIEQVFNEILSSLDMVTK